MHAHDQVEIKELKKNYALIIVKEFQMKKFPVRIQAGKDSIQAVCTCPGGEKYLCEHKIAASYALEEHLYKKPLTFWQDALSDIIDVIGQNKKETTKKKGILVFSLSPASSGIDIDVFMISDLELPEKAYKNNLTLARAIKPQITDKNSTRLYDWSKKLLECGSPPESIAAAKMILGTGRKYFYTKGEVETLILLLSHCPTFRGIHKEPFRYPLHIIEEAPPIELNTESINKDINISLSVTTRDKRIPLKKSKISTIGEFPLWILYEDIIFPIKKSIEFFQQFLDIEEVRIPSSEVGEFVDEYLVPIAEEVNIRGEFEPSGEIKVNPVKRIYMSEDKGELRADLRFYYSGYEFPYSSRQTEYSIIRKKGSNKLIKVLRDTKLEETAREALTEFGLKRIPKTELLSLKKNIAPVDFLFSYVPRMTEAGYEVYGEESLAIAKINRLKPTVSFNIKSGIDWFDIKTLVNFGNLQVSMKDIKQALKKNKKYIKLSDGSVGLLSDDWVKQYQHLFFLGEETRDGVRMSKHHLSFIDQLLEKAEDIEVDNDFKARRKMLKNFESIKNHKLPSAFNGTLRNYQKAGYNWLHFLHEYNLGGCLADDMGTGKTVQTLVYLQSHRENGGTPAPDLIVMPRSLIFNWEREAAKFTPNLKILIHSGQERYNSLEKLEKYDLILTTYGLLRQDIDHLKDFRFHHVILDESQTIKNPISKTAKAARKLQCDHRLVLTGTPIENNTVELWSQFAFLNPGLLGTLSYFKEQFANPIEKNQDEETAEILRRMVFPFILRRTKEQVESELPPRTERVYYCDMDPAQKKLYDKKKNYYRGLLLGMIDEGGVNNARMKMLEGLLRLRQICNHPRLVAPDAKESSAKFEQLLEILDTLRSEGHKALIFSQFTKMLGLVKESLEERNIPFVYLDGQTRDREEQVDKFQKDPDIPFFLISLKAGGVGLNLTAAGYVINIDPWWNPAAEMQAADRAHRIGQDKPVFVYKMIVRDSVEEKILQLQEKKKNLMAQLIKTESSFFKSLNGDDVKTLFS